MYIGVGWRVKGNKEAAENLANFLINCELNRITSLKPIKFSGDLIELDYSGTYFPFKTPKSWGYGPGFCAYSLYDKEKDRAEGEEEKIRVVSLLKKLDKEGIVLPFFDKLNGIPGIILDRVSYINNNERHKDSKLSEVLKRTDSLSPSKDFFSENFTKFNIPDYTAKAVSLTKNFTQQGPEVIYNGEYFFNRDSVFLQNITVEIKKRIRLKKEAIENIEKYLLNVKYIDADREKDGVLNPRKLELIDNAGYKFTVKKVYLGNLLINKDYTDKRLNGAIYNPQHTEDLTTLETLATWLLENNVSQEETKLEEKAETTAPPTAQQRQQEKLILKRKIFFIT